MFLAYEAFGPMLPPPWTHQGYGIEPLVDHMYMTLEGIFGVPLDVAATFIILFTIYRAVLDHSKAGEFFVNFSLAALEVSPPERNEPSHSRRFFSAARPAPASPRR